jgi:hypothetical protein
MEHQKLTNKDIEAAHELLGRTLKTPGLAQALKVFVDTVGDDPIKIKDFMKASVADLKAACDTLPKVPAKSEDLVVQEITFDGYKALEAYVKVNVTGARSTFNNVLDKTVRAVLSEHTFTDFQDPCNGAMKLLKFHRDYASKLGGRMATRDENCGLVDALLKKEKQGTLNQAEVKLLKIYRENLVCDAEGCICVDIRGHIDWFHISHMNYQFYRGGALIILP